MYTHTHTHTSKIILFQPKLFLINNNEQSSYLEINNHPQLHPFLSTSMAHSVTHHSLPLVTWGIYILLNN